MRIASEQTVHIAGQLIQQALLIPARITYKVLHLLVVAIGNGFLEAFDICFERLAQNNR